jgi:hypothetical protein
LENTEENCEKIGKICIFQIFSIFNFHFFNNFHGYKRIQHPNVKKSSKPRTLQDTFKDLLSNIQKPLGIHHIRTILFSLLFSIKNVADVNSIDSFVSKRNMEEFSVVIMKRLRSNWFKKTKGRHVTYNTRQSVLRRKRKN